MRYTENTEKHCKVCALWKIRTKRGRTTINQGYCMILQRTTRPETKCPRPRKFTHVKDLPTPEMW